MPTGLAVPQLPHLYSVDGKSTYLAGFYEALMR